MNLSARDSTTSSTTFSCRFSPPPLLPPPTPTPFRFRLFALRYTTIFGCCSTPRGGDPNVKNAERKKESRKEGGVAVHYLTGNGAPGADIGRCTLHGKDQKKNFHQNAPLRERKFFPSPFFLLTSVGLQVAFFLVYR